MEASGPAPARMRRRELPILIWSVVREKTDNGTDPPGPAVGILMGFSKRTLAQALQCPAGRCWPCARQAERLQAGAVPGPVRKAPGNATAQPRRSCPTQTAQPEGRCEDGSLRTGPCADAPSRIAYPDLVCGFVRKTDNGTYGTYPPVPRSEFEWFFEGVKKAPPDF